jgi:signal transduction histidine kinase/tetratricopeptide (TPR) repeat protein
MKKFFVFLLLLITIVSSSQNLELEKTVKALKEDIKNANKAERLKLTDSLITLVEFNETYHYTPLIKENIALALEIDSIGLATKHTADFIYYTNHIIGDPAKGLEVFKDFAGKEKNSKDLKAAANLYQYGSDSYFFLRDLSSSLELLQTAKDYAIKSGDKNKLASVLVRTGFVESEMGHFAAASQNLQTARNIFIETKDTVNLLGANNALSILYSQNKFYKEAKDIRDESIELSKKTSGNPYLFTLYYNTAADQREQGNHAERIKYLKLAYAENEKSHHRNLYYPVLLSDFVIAYAESDSLELAEAYFSEVGSNKDLLTKGINRDYYIEAYKQISLARKQYNDAIKYGKEHLELKKKQGAFVEIYNADKFLAEAYKAAGNNEKANEHLVAYYKIKDSISNTKNVQTLTYYQTIFETEKRDLTIQAQQTNIALLDEKNLVKNQWILFGSIGFLSLFGFVWVLRSRNFARKKQKLQESFTQDILKTQEQERARIASELHDNVGQKLLLIKNALASKEPPSKNEIDLVGETIEEVREMSHNLHPFQFEKLGLITSIKNMVETFQKNSNVFYSEDIDTPDGLIDKDNEIYVFRMLQEAMTNVEKHAESTACNLSSKETKNHLVFVMKDNGKGFKTETALNRDEGLGMKTLKERALFIGAELKIESTIGKGTTLTLKIPGK